MADTPPTSSVAQERAAHLRITPGSLMQLSLGDAQEVERYMLPRCITAGTTFIHTGESKVTDYLLLVIDGEVTVESQRPSGMGTTLSHLYRQHRPACGVALARSIIPLD